MKASRSRRIHRWPVPWFLSRWWHCWLQMHHEDRKRIGIWIHESMLLYRIEWKGFIWVTRYPNSNHRISPRHRTDHAGIRPLSCNSPAEYPWVIYCPGHTYYIDGFKWLYSVILFFFVFFGFERERESIFSLLGNDYRKGNSLKFFIAIDVVKDADIDGNDGAEDTGQGHRREFIDKSHAQEDN